MTLILSTEFEVSSTTYTDGFSELLNFPGHDLSTDLIISALEH